MPLPSEQALLPPQPLRFNQIFFKDFDLAPQGGLFRWHIIAAMLLTGFGLFFAGCSSPAGRWCCSIPRPWATAWRRCWWSRPVFMHNLVNTPAYATLTVFGVSAFFAWFWVRGWQGGAGAGRSAGGPAGRSAGAHPAGDGRDRGRAAGCVGPGRQLRFLRHFILGGLPALALLLLYNVSQFGNALHAGILNGDMSALTFDLSYVLATLAGPQSGILFWSVLTSAGDHWAVCSARGRRSKPRLGGAGADRVDRACACR